MHLFEEFGYIKNEERCIEEMRNLVSELKGFTNTDLIKHCNKSAKDANECIYFNIDYSCASKVDDSLPLKIINTGYENENGDSIYAQFIKVRGSWHGALIGSKTALATIQCEHLKYKNLSKESNANTEFFELLYSKLMTPNSWTVESLENYMSQCITRLNNCIAKGSHNYIIFNKDCSCGLINSGLLDKFGKYIMIVVEVYNSEPQEAPYLRKDGLRLGGSKVSLIDLGFTKESLVNTIERVSFCENGVLGLVFVDGIEEFDIDSRMRLDHCIRERRSRFPAIFADVSDEVVYADIVKAIQIGVELNKYDRNYIKPIYNGSRDCIDFVIPYHVANDFQKKPELGILVSYINDYWQIMTVLNYQDVLKDIKLFNMYENETF